MSYEKAKKSLLCRQPKAAEVPACQNTPISPTMRVKLKIPTSLYVNRARHSSS